MQFPNQLVTEIFAPDNVAFAPGNNVSGFGADLPPELAAAGYTNAIVFYSTDWNPAAVVPTVKFKFIATNGGSLITGYGVCTNPSVSQVATVLRGTSTGMIVFNGKPVTDIETFNQNNHSVFQFATGGASSNEPYFIMRNDAGATRAQLTTDGGSVNLGLGGRLIGTVDGFPTNLVVDAPLKDTNFFNGFTLGMLNGWTGTLKAYRTGTGTVLIQSNGTLTSPANPGIFQQIATLPAGFVPTNGSTVVACRAGSTSGLTGIGSDGSHIYIDHGNIAGLIPNAAYVFVNLVYTVA
jgi:hypothetical protein